MEGKKWDANVMKGKKQSKEGEKMQRKRFCKNIRFLINFFPVFIANEKVFIVLLVSFQAVVLCCAVK